MKFRIGFGSLKENGGKLVSKGSVRMGGPAYEVRRVSPRAHEIWDACTSRNVEVRLVEECSDATGTGSLEPMKPHVVVFWARDFRSPEKFRFRGFPLASPYFFDKFGDFRLISP